MWKWVYLFIVKYKSHGNQLLCSKMFRFGDFYLAVNKFVLRCSFTDSLNNLVLWALDFFLEYLNMKVKWFTLTVHVWNWMNFLLCLNVLLQNVEVFYKFRRCRNHKEKEALACALWARLSFEPCSDRDAARKNSSSLFPLWSTSSYWNPVPCKGQHFSLYLNKQ